MKEYFEASVAQHVERGRQLLALTESSDIPTDFLLLAQRCKVELTDAISDLKELLADLDAGEIEAQKIRLRRFRRATDKINVLETTGVAALSRRNDNDIFLNRLLGQIRHEINYPLIPPTVTALSKDYFYILSGQNLMFVPLTEGDFLLHLPDIYHELAHPLLYEGENNPRVEPYQMAVMRAFLTAAAYLDAEVEKEAYQHNPVDYLLYLYLWQRCWWKWVAEFFCDLFAAFTVGPAFAWSHLHICMKAEHDPYSVPTRSLTSHPADDARMRLILLVLEHLSYDTSEIRERWRQYLQITGATREPEYDRCYPENLLKTLVEIGCNALRELRCRAANPDGNGAIFTVLNRAWGKFWSDPSGYRQWEKNTVHELRLAYGVNELTQVDL